MDGLSLSQLMHKRGINMRYLGRLAELASAKTARLQAFLTVIVQEMIVRAFKHVSIQLLATPYQQYLLVPVSRTCSTACLARISIASLNRRLMKSLRGFYPDGDFSFERLTPKQLREDVVKQIKMRYRYTLPQDWSSCVKPLQLLRELCLRNGFQIKARDYEFGRGDQLIADTSPVVDGSENQQTNGVHADDGKKKRKKARREAHTPVELQPSQVRPSQPKTFLNIVPTVKDAAPKSALAEEALGSRQDFAGARPETARSRACARVSVIA